jgi:2-polyprenyl-3-methyl-5-hydroxy-6-metoxy-1,4-benzoquinol methylase
MRKALLKYNYPQIVFAKQTVKYLNGLNRSIKTIIDCPCGNGETSYTISNLTGARVIAADISADSIENCKLNFKSPELSYEVNSIESVLNSHKEFDVFCILNSLFLLENYDQILKTLSKNTGENNAQTIIIIPNTDGNNFKWFQSQHTDENKLVIRENEIQSFFLKYGFKTELIEPICFAHHYNRKDIKLFSVFWSVYLNLVNSIQTALKIGKPNYFLIALSADRT